MSQDGSADAATSVVSSLNHAVRGGFVNRIALRADDAFAGFKVTIGHVQSARNQRGDGPDLRTVKALEPPNAPPIMP